MSEPIKLTDFGDTLKGFPPHGTEDNEEMPPFCIGFHDICGGTIFRNQISKTHQALFCKGCNLRVVISAEIKTYGQLRQVLESELDGNK